MERGSVLVNSWADSICSVDKRLRWLNLQLLREREKTSQAWFNDAEWKRITITLDWNRCVPTRRASPPQWSKGQNNQLTFYKHGGRNSLINQLLPPTGPINCWKTILSWWKCCSWLQSMEKSTLIVDRLFHQRLFMNRTKPSGFNSHKIPHWPVQICYWGNNVHLTTERPRLQKPVQSERNHRSL